jgi:hypothetical protein
MARTASIPSEEAEAESSPFFDPAFAQSDPASAFTGPGASRLFAEAAEAAAAAFTRRAPTPNSSDETASMKHLAYWKYCMDETCNIEGHVERRGHIMIGPGSKGLFAHEQCTEYRTATHSVSLEPKYGCWVQNQWYEDGLRGGSPYDRRFPYGTFANLFKSPGGIFEMPVDQWISCGFHKLPEFQAYRPDVAEYPIISCKQCIGREFLLPMHLENHRSAVHKESLQAVASAEAMGEKFAEFSNQNSNQSMAMMLKLMSAMEDKIKALEAERKA